MQVVLQGSVGRAEAFHFHFPLVLLIKEQGRCKMPKYVCCLVRQGMQQEG